MASSFLPFSTKERLPTPISFMSNEPHAPQELGAAPGQQGQREVAGAEGQVGGLHGGGVGGGLSLTPRFWLG